MTNEDSMTIHYYRVKIKIKHPVLVYTTYHGIAHSSDEACRLALNQLKRDGLEYANLDDIYECGPVDFAPGCFTVGTEPNGLMFVGVD